jgi:hypothetical protein
MACPARRRWRTEMRLLPEGLKWWLRTFTRSGRQKWLEHELGPRGVRILHADGRVSECTLVRDPEDRNSRAQWLAVPPEGTVCGPGDHLAVDYLPGRTEITLAVGFDVP